MEPDRVQTVREREAARLEREAAAEDGATGVPRMSRKAILGACAGGGGRGWMEGWGCGGGGRGAEGKRTR
jgi:hypothetical protein